MMVIYFECMVCLFGWFVLSASILAATNGYQLRQRSISRLSSATFGSGRFYHGNVVIVVVRIIV